MYFHCSKKKWKNEIEVLDAVEESERIRTNGHTIIVIKLQIYGENVYEKKNKPFNF